MRLVNLLNTKWDVKRAMREHLVANRSAISVILVSPHLNNRITQKSQPPSFPIPELSDKKSFAFREITGTVNLLETKSFLGADRRLKSTGTVHDFHHFRLAP